MLNAADGKYLKNNAEVQFWSFRMMKIVNKSSFEPKITAFSLEPYSEMIASLLPSFPVHSLFVPFSISNLEEKF